MHTRSDEKLPVSTHNDSTEFECGGDLSSFLIRSLAVAFCALKMSYKRCEAASGYASEKSTVQSTFIVSVCI